jgi:DMSO/TMAO reductase YedYZ molybdopterin-dependent catalytic subunit
MAMPRSTVYGEIYCYGRFVTGGNWTGVSLRFLLESVAFDQNAGSVAFYAEDGYTIDISIQEAMRPDVIIAYELDGQPLSETLRLVLPGQNGNRWIAQINQITVSMAAASSQPSAASAELAPVGQQSPTPQPTPTPTPQTTPSPSPTPSSSPTPSVSPPTAKPEPEPFPIALTVIAIATVAVGGIGLTVYFKKRNH